MNFKEILKEAIKNNTKIIITGRSGYGKSEMVAQVAKELGMELIDFRLSEVLPEDLVGIPKIKDDYYEYVPPKWLYDVVQNPDKQYLLFLDEITQGTPEVLNITYKIFDKITRVGNYTLNNVAVVGATNYQNESNYINELPTPLKNRACMLELDHSEGIYSNYLMTKYKDLLVDLKKDDKVILEGFIKDTIKDTNPRSTDKAIELIHNNCSEELITPFIGYANYSNLVTYFSNNAVDISTLSNLDKATRDLNNGFITLGKHRYDIESPSDLVALYDLTEEENEIITYKYTEEFMGNKTGNKRETIYAIINQITDPTISLKRLTKIANESPTFNWLTYAGKIKLMAKDQESVNNQIDIINAIIKETGLTAMDLFKHQNSMIQYCAPELLIHFKDDINWQLYAELYKKGRISQRSADKTMPFFKEYL